LTGQLARWWETHSPRLQTWKNVSKYFIECFRENKIDKATNISTFKIRCDLAKHIHNYEKEWHIIKYIDERVWPHMFPSMLDKIPSKWYNIKESCGHKLDWFYIK
jgi:hypothetical protein